MDRAASWGIDAMRVPGFTWARSRSVPGTDDPVWLAHYDAIIDAAWARRFAGVVDFHQERVRGKIFCGDGFPRIGRSRTLRRPHSIVRCCRSCTSEI